LHNNYYTIRQVSRQLAQKLPGWELRECFSQNKNELILAFGKGQEEFYIKASFNSDFSCLSFPDNFSRSKRNNVDLFPSLIGKKCIEIYQFNLERSFWIRFSDESRLLFKIHGNLSNLLLIRSNKPEQLFKNNLKNDWELDTEKLDRNIQIDFEHFRQADFQPRKFLPTLDKFVVDYLTHQGFYLLENEKKWDVLSQTLSLLNNPRAFYLSYKDAMPALLLFPAYEVKEEYSDPLTALTHFYHEYASAHSLKKEKNEVLNKLEQQKTKTGNYLIKTRDKLKKLQQESRHEEIANIIMANLHQIPRHKSEAELYDFYHDRPINIRLKKDLSPQQNAEIYYRKAKNQKFEINNLQKGIEVKSGLIDKFEEEIAQIKSIPDLKSLRSYLKDTGLKKEKSKEPERFPFWHFEINGYKIWVGKNAANNDLLTQKYTHKNDLWLHAKDVTGSHVVVKQKGEDNFPEPVIEQAAEIAAFFSKRKNDTLCPVQYTLKKYVRKPKGSLPGLVILEREDVILVTPKRPGT